MTIFIGNKIIECVRKFQCLGFHILYDIDNPIDNREANAMNMANIVHKALRTSSNVYIDLKLSLMEKKLFIFHYMGAPYEDCQILIIR